MSDTFRSTWIQQFEEKSRKSPLDFKGRSPFSPEPQQGTDGPGLSVSDTFKSTWNHLTEFEEKSRKSPLDFKGRSPFSPEQQGTDSPGLSVSDTFKSTWNHLSDFRLQSRELTEDFKRSCSPFSPEPQQGPDCPELSISDNSRSTRSHYLQILEQPRMKLRESPLDFTGRLSPFSPEPQQGPNCPGLSISDNSRSTGNHYLQILQQPRMKLRESPLDFTGRLSPFSLEPQQRPDGPGLSMSDNSWSVDSLDYLEQLKVPRMKLRESPLDFTGRLSPYTLDFPSFSSKNEDVTADGDSERLRMKLRESPLDFTGRRSPFRKLDESGLPTNQEFTVGGGKTVEVTTTRLVSSTVSAAAASTHCITVHESSVTLRQSI